MKRLALLLVLLALAAVPCLAQDPGFVERVDEAWRTHDATRFLSVVDAEAKTNACFEVCFVQGVSHVLFGDSNDGTAAAAFDDAERFAAEAKDGRLRFDPVAVRSLRRSWEHLPELSGEGKGAPSTQDADLFAQYPDAFPDWSEFDTLRARPDLPVFPFDGTIVSISRDKETKGDIGEEAGVLVGGLIGLGVGKVAELFDPPQKDDFMTPSAAGLLGGAVVGGIIGHELQKERFPSLGRHWRATVSPADGTKPVSVDLGHTRGPWKSNQTVRVFRDLDTGMISLEPRAEPEFHAENAESAEPKPLAESADGAEEPAP